MWQLGFADPAIQAGRIDCLQHPSINSMYRGPADSMGHCWAGSVRYLAPVVEAPNRAYIGQFWFYIPASLKEDRIRRGVELAHLIAWERTRGINLNENAQNVQSIMDIFQSFFREALIDEFGMNQISVSPNTLSPRCDQILLSPQPRRPPG